MECLTVTANCSLGAKSVSAPSLRMWEVFTVYSLYSILDECCFIVVDGHKTVMLSMVVLRTCNTHVICTHIHAHNSHTCTHARMHARTHAHMHTRMYACTHAHTCIAHTLLLCVHMTHILTCIVHGSRMLELPFLANQPVAKVKLQNYLAKVANDQPKISLIAFFSH